jgi:hypothetical protein
MSAIVEESLLRQKISDRNPKPKIIKNAAILPYNKKYYIGLVINMQLTGLIFRS